MDTPETYTMNMECDNCSGHSTMVFKRGEPCKFKAVKSKDTHYFLCPHCGCSAARATHRTPNAGIKEPLQ